LPESVTPLVESCPLILSQVAVLLPETAATLNGMVPPPLEATSSSLVIGVAADCPVV